MRFAGLVVLILCLAAPSALAATTCARPPSLCRPNAALAGGGVSALFGDTSGSTPARCQGLRCAIDGTPFRNAAPLPSPDAQPGLPAASCFLALPEGAAPRSPAVPPRPSSRARRIDRPPRA